MMFGYFNEILTSCYRTYHFGMSGIDVFVGNYPVIDWDLYRLWVEGEINGFSQP